MNPQVLSSQNSFFATFLASFLIWLMFFGLFVLWIIDGRIKKEQVLHAFFAIITAWSLSLIIKNLFPTLRPFMVTDNPLLTITPITGSSFPSSHATVAFAMAFSIWFHNKKIGTFFVVCAILVGFGRIISNAHFTIDVIGGIIIALTVSSAIKKLHLFKALKRN